MVALSWHRVSFTTQCHEPLPFSKLAVLGTEFEIWTCCLQGVREIEEWMSRSSGVPLETLRKHLFLFRDRDATSHLLRQVFFLTSILEVLPQ